MRLLAFLAIIFICTLGQACLGKTGRSLLTDERIRQARENVQKHDWARASLESTKAAVQWVLDMPDEELWEFIPPADQTRALNVCFGVGCPVHGKEVFKVGANYPWIMSRDKPFKVECPVGHEVYPSNDFEPWHNGGKKGNPDEKYYDDGEGWVGPDGNRYWFVGHYLFWQRWRTDILPVIPQLAEAYVLTGDTRYSHKAAVMLARIASEYPKMNYNSKQAYHNGYWPARCTGKILDLDWEGSGTVVPLSTAYDQIYPEFDKDADLTGFLAGKGIADARDSIEANFLQEAARAIESGIIHGNMNYQAQLGLVATVLDNKDPAKGFTTDQMVDWIMNGGGEMNSLLFNGVSRDGAGSEESIGYTTIWTVAFLNLAEKLKPLGYDLYANPRLKQMADFYIRTVVADKFGPRIGDAGIMTSALGPVLSQYIYEKAFDAWGDPMYAKVLNRIGWPKPTVYEKPEAVEAKQKEAEPLGTDLGLKTRNLGGYGLAVLESGEGENRRAVTMFYGASGAWHGHLDRLNIEGWAYGKQFLPEIGYPAHWGDKAEYWARSTPSHYCVLIDENRQAARMEGFLHLMAESPEVQMVDASGENAYRGAASLYRRTLTMVDATPQDSYLVDIFRIKGGSVHDYSFHGLPFGELSIKGVTLGPTQTKGTLMGEDIEFGKVFDGMKTGGYQFLFSPRRGNPEGRWSADWFVKDTGLGLRWTMLPGSADEVIVTDCEPEPKPGFPEKFEYILARRRGGDSTYVSIVEPYKGKPYVKQAQLLSRTDDIVAVRIDCEGRTDYILNRQDAKDAKDDVIGDIKFSGRFGSITEDDGGMRSMFLVNGRELSKDGYSLKPVETLEASVAAVDYRENAITLDRAVPLPDSLVGQVVVFSNEDHSASYTVESVGTHGGRTVLRFGGISLIEGTGEITAVDDAAKTVTTSTRLTGYGIKWVGKLFPGRWMLNEEMTFAWPITGCEKQVFTVKADAPISGKLTDADGNKRRFFYIGEVGIGDRVMIPSIVSVTRTAPDTYDVRATVPFDFSMPVRRIGQRVAEYQVGGKWRTAEHTKSGPALTVEVGVEMLRDGKAVLRMR